MSNKDLRQNAVDAIAAYMHHELWSISKTADMMPWMTSQGDQIMSMVDNAVSNARKHPAFKELNK